MNAFVLVHGAWGGAWRTPLRHDPERRAPGIGRFRDAARCLCGFGACPAVPLTGGLGTMEWGSCACGVDDGSWLKAKMDECSAEVNTTGSDRWKKPECSGA